jgi:hypothetical protein
MQDPHWRLTIPATTKYASPAKCLPLSDLDPKQVQVSLAGKALPPLRTTCQPISHERSCGQISSVDKFRPPDRQSRNQSG